MSYFGKIFGTLAGFATGGPFGALLGAALGHAADKKTLLTPPFGVWSEQWKRKLNPDVASASCYMAVKMASAAGKKEQVYGLCAIILSAKLAKCDGPVNRKEINAFKKSFVLPKQQLHQVGKLFDHARNRSDDFLLYAEELAKNFKHEKNKLQNILILLFNIARADHEPSSSVNDQEKKLLRQVHALFGLSENDWNEAWQGKHLENVTNEPDPYKILDLPPSATDNEIKTRWMTLVKTYHPDRILSTKASPDEIKQSSEKIMKINAAWDSIKRNRRL